MLLLLKYTDLNDNGRPSVYEFTRPMNGQIKPPRRQILSLKRVEANKETTCMGSIRPSEQILFAKKIECTQIEWNVDKWKLINA